MTSIDLNFNTIIDFPYGFHGMKCNAIIERLKSLNIQYLIVIAEKCETSKIDMPSGLYVFKQFKKIIIKCDFYPSTIKKVYPVDIVSMSYNSSTCKKNVSLKVSQFGRDRFDNCRMFGAFNKLTEMKKIEDVALHMIKTPPLDIDIHYIGCRICKWGSTTIFDRFKIAYKTYITLQTRIELNPSILVSMTLAFPDTDYETGLYYTTFGILKDPSRWPDKNIDRAYKSVVKIVLSLILQGFDLFLISHMTMGLMVEELRSRSIRDEEYFIKSLTALVGREKFSNVMGDVSQILEAYTNKMFNLIKK